MFIKKIKFNTDVIYESNREDQKSKFKIKKRTYIEDNLRKPIYDSNMRTNKYEKVKVVERTFTIFPKDFEVNFKGNLTVIVGDNGYGKSSLIKFLKPPDVSKLFSFDKTKEELIKEAFQKYVDNSVNSLYFEGSPKYFVIEQNLHKNSFIEEQKDKVKNSITGMNVANLWDMQNDSNGENMIDFINSIKMIENGLIVLDEPETSLSIKSQYKIRKILEDLSKNNQIIIITHSTIFMNLCEEVYDFETKQYTPTYTYILSQHNNQ